MICSKFLVIFTISWDSIICSKIFRNNSIDIARVSSWHSKSIKRLPKVCGSF